jgi:hypothetical protein
VSRSYSTHVIMRNSYKDLDRKFEKRQLWTSVHRWKDNVETDIKEVIWECLDWVCLTQDTEP